MKSTTIAFVLFALTMFPANAEKLKPPSCVGNDHWPVSISYSHLLNQNVIGTDDVVQDKTEDQLLVAEYKGKDKSGGHVWREVHHVAFHLTNGSVIKTIVIFDADDRECSHGYISVLKISDEFADPVEPRH